MASRFVVVALLAALAWACAPRIAAPPEIGQNAPANFPEAHYRQALTQGRPVYRVDPAASLLAIEARRGGSLARLGHDHVIASHGVMGYVSPEEGRSDLYVQLGELVVDEPELRAQSRFDTQPSADDIAGTRQNMLRALAAEQYPFAVIEINRLDGGRLKVTISLHGATRSFEIPVQIDSNANELEASGRIDLKQTDFGIKPFSILGGAVQVQDEVNLRFSIRARRIEAQH